MEQGDEASSVNKESPEQQLTRDEDGATWLNLTLGASESPSPDAAAAATAASCSAEIGSGSVSS